MYFNTSKDYWRLLRRMRATPPPAAVGNDPRRGTFSAALEQAEQLFAAASSVGMESKPILLYYGTYQAGRAIAAANNDTSAPWQLDGHGLKAPLLSNRDRAGVKNRPNLASMIARGTGKPQEAFPVIARMLNTPDLTEEIKFGTLLALLDESRCRTYSGGSNMFPSLEELPGPIAVSIEVLAVRNGVDVVGVAGLPRALLRGDDWQSKVRQFLLDFYPQFGDRWTVDEIAESGGLVKPGHVVLSRKGEIIRHAMTTSRLPMTTAGQLLMNCASGSPTIPSMMSLIRRFLVSLDRCIVCACGGPPCCTFR